MNQIYKVSELTREIKAILEGKYPFIAVAGEISNLRKPYSGHLYFTLKDESGQLRAVLFKLQQRYLSEIPKDGQHVICRGRISVYEPRGDYQLIVDTIDFHGRGALQLNYERLKSKLAAEGLFEPERKKKIPLFPEHITLVTSPRGAAVHDFVNIAVRRYPPVHLLVYPVSVQGTHAAQEMIDALTSINRSLETDVIVLCRGGGSLEDLWAFNDEELARVIYRSKIPIVSAVGHEIDFTIADLVADIRAPTPSSAAEIVVPDKKSVSDRLKRIRSSLLQSLQRTLLEKENRLQSTMQVLGHAPQPIDSLLLTVDRLAMRLKHSMVDTLKHYNARVSLLDHKVEQKNPASTLQIQQRQLENTSHRFFHSANTSLKEKTVALQRAASVLDAVSPLATIARGYSITRKINQRKTIIRTVGQVRKNEKINVRIQDGELECRVDNIDKLS